MLEKIVNIRVSLLIIGIALMFVSLMFIALPDVASAQDPTTPSGAAEDVCKGVGLAGGSDECDTGNSGSSLGSIITNVINLLSIVVGVASVIMIIIGGFRYITSSGDSGAIKGARDTIIYALVGLVIVGVSQALVKFVIGTI